jgi:presenilin-like A22 family membrane protease
LANNPIKKRILKVIFAVVVNAALFTALFVYLLSGKDSVLWSIVLPSVCHIVLCLTLIYFLHKDSDWTFFF